MACHCYFIGSLNHLYCTKFDLLLLFRLRTLGTLLGFHDIFYFMHQGFSIKPITNSVGCSFDASFILFCIYTSRKKIQELTIGKAYLFTIPSFSYATGRTPVFDVPASFDNLSLLRRYGASWCCSS